MVSSQSQYNPTKHKSKKSENVEIDIPAIRNYYQHLNFDDEVEHIRYCTEFKRLSSLIQNHWRANKFPKCEQMHVSGILEDLLKVAKYHESSERIIDQLEDYLKYIQKYSDLENRLKNQVIQRQDSMRTLKQISENAEDLWKFEKDGPQLLLNLRGQALRIVKYLKALTELKNSVYIEKTQPQLYFFELDEGHGNILDLIRDGKFQKACHQIPSRKKI